MATPITPIECRMNDKVADKFVVKKKLGEGSCGQVFLVNEVDKDGKVKRRAAMKIEPRMKQKEDEILKMEIFVLKKLQNSKHCCRLVAHGHQPTYTYVVMSLLGAELADLRKRCPNRRFSHPTALRLSIQAVKALQDLHEAGFVHRDIKPSNLAMGYERPSILYVFDFGLARQILVSDGKGGQRLREERPRVMFRGTVRYCSLNVHLFKEQGRHDDLIAFMHSMIECVSMLPWRGQMRKEAGKTKEKTPDSELCRSCPPAFLYVLKVIRRLKYKEVPPYAQLMNCFKGGLPASLKMTDPYEWTKKAVSERETNKERSSREKAEFDKDPDHPDQKTINEIEDSVVTDDDKSKGFDEGEFPANDDTLDGM